MRGGCPWAVSGGTGEIKTAGFRGGQGEITRVVSGNEGKNRQAVQEGIRWAVSGGTGEIRTAGFRG